MTGNIPLRGANLSRGSGLGLFIANGIGEALGGEGAVRSMLGAGSGFRFSIP